MLTRAILAAALLLGLAVAPADAASIVINGRTYTVSDSDAADLARAAETKQTAQAVETIGEYAELGRTIGIGVATAAKELGIAVNEFASTPIGVLATGIIVWKLMGKAVVGALWLLIALPIWYITFRRMAIFKRRVERVDDKGRKIVEYDYYTPSDNVEEIRFMFAFALAIILGLGLMLMFG